MTILTQPRKIYWDACVWIALINGEAGRVERCESVIALAKNGDLQIFTSTLTLTEVYKPGGQSVGISLQKLNAFEEFLLQDFIVEVQLDHDTAVDARNLLQQFPGKLKGCQDAIHLASARLSNCDELHTFDGRNLLPLNGTVIRIDGTPLLIREPPQPVVGTQQDLFATKKTDVSIEASQEKMDADRDQKP
jgi:predicted nucleic acid-binding protein